MTVTTGEMTLAEMYRDPLILSVMRADGIALNEFKEMMAAATASLKTRGATLPEVRFGRLNPQRLRDVRRWRRCSRCSHVHFNRAVQICNV